MSTILTFKSPGRRLPSIENGRVLPPRRMTNLERRSREHLLPAEVERLVAAAGKVGRHGPRDATLILSRIDTDYAWPSWLDCGGNRSTCSAAPCT